MPTPWDVGTVNEQIRSGEIPSGDADPTATWAAPRQLKLDRLWKVYRTQQYEDRRFDWNGRETVGKIERDVIARTGNIPPGFYDAGAELAPLDFRAPSAPTHLPRLVVNRFTSLLFSEKRHPVLLSDDEETTDWLEGFAETTRLWAQMIRARTFGGAMGSVGLGFKFVSGRPVVEIHDPRWCTPKIGNRDTGELDAFEKLYQFQEDVRNADGEWETRVFWYRRLITDKLDVVWPKVPVEGNANPLWDRMPCQIVQHNFGFCPVVWVQNLDFDDALDGDPDCHGALELAERVDVLWSQADRGTVANCDPSVILASDREFDEIRKGSGNALQVEAGGSAKYMEISGAGIDKAMALAEKLEERALELVRCKLDKDGSTPKTATEIEHNYSSMLEQADLLREQYGERGLKPLLEMVLRAAKQVATSKIVAGADGIPRVTRGEIKLARRKVTDANGRIVGWKDRRIGSGSVVELTWPQYFTPSEDARAAAVKTAGEAKKYGLLDRAHAVDHVAGYFDIKDKARMVDELDRAEKEALGPDPAELAAQRSAETKPMDPLLELQKDKVELTATDKSTIVTVDEARHAMGLPPLGGEDGELTVAAFKAKYRILIKTSVEATDTEGGVPGEEEPGAGDQWSEGEEDWGGGG